MHLNESKIIDWISQKIKPTTFKILDGDALTQNYDYLSIFTWKPNQS